MSRKIVIICVDGLGPDYLEAAPTPAIDRMGRDGVFVVGSDVIPSVTNVNNVSVITGTPPARHGITSNYWLDRQTGEEQFMESAAFVLQPTVLERARQRGMTTALLTSKLKLLRLLDAGADYAVAAEDPDADLRAAIGDPPGIYSPGINPWLFQALAEVLRRRDPDVVYCSTTDGVMHKNPPESEQSCEHLSRLDAILGRIVDENPGREFYLTADHGMSAKTRGVDLERVLAAAGIEARALPIIKDRYVAHHQNLGGASYVYLERPEAVGEALAALRQCGGVDEVYSRDEAAATFELMPDRIGDAFVLGSRETVFGSFDAVEVEVRLRSHGSRHESAVPIISYNAPPRQYRRNYDPVALLDL